METTWMGNILVFIRQPLPYLLSFCIVLGFLIFGPGWITQDLGVNQVVLQYRWAFGLGFAISIIAVLAIVLSVVSSHAKSFFENKVWHRRRIRRLYDLTPPEKQIIRWFFSNNTRSCDLNITDGIVNGLVAEEIIYRSSNISKGGTFFAHNIQPWAWDYLRKNPHLLN